MVGTRGRSGRFRDAWAPYCILIEQVDGATTRTLPNESENRSLIPLSSLCEYTVTAEARASTTRVIFSSAEAFDSSDRGTQIGDSRRGGTVFDLNNSGSNVGFLLITALLSLLSGLPSSIDSANKPVQFTSTAHSSAAPGVQPPLNRQPAPGEATRAWVKEAYGQLPLSFEANRGQANAETKFLARGYGYTFLLTSTETLLSLDAPHTGQHSLTTDRAADVRPTMLPPTVLRMKLVGANPLAEGIGHDQLPGKSNYLIGSAPMRWRTNVPQYGKVRYKGVYPGVDVVYYGAQGQLGYDLQVGAGSDPRVIQFSFEGAEAIRLSHHGDLILTVGGSDLRQLKPVVYQEVDGVRHEIAGGYHVDGNRVRFELGTYDASLPLVIDPVLAYSTYLGGSVADFGAGIAVDKEGYAYVTGLTRSADFPTTANAFQPGFNSGIEDVFVTKLNREGSAVVYSTYLGGSFFDRAFGIAVDKNGNAYITGTTASSDFPTTMNAFQANLAGDIDVFVTTLNRDGSALVYSTYLGGTRDERGLSIAVDEDRHAYVTGDTFSSDFPVTAGAFQSAYSNGGDSFVTKLNRSGSGVVYSTYLGGDSGDLAESIAVDENGHAYVGGGTASSEFPTTPGAFQPTFAGARDGFVTKLNRSGSGLVYSTYLGGDSEDTALDIVLDRKGAVYVAGYSRSLDFPTTPDAFQPTFGGPEDPEIRSDAFVTKLNRHGSALAYSTYVGGNDQDVADGIAVDEAGRTYITGVTASPNFPTVDAVQPAHGGNFDAFVTKLSRKGSALVYSTYLGGSDADFGQRITVDQRGNAYVIGFTDSLDFPTTVHAFQPTSAGSGDVFVVKIGAAKKAEGDGKGKQ
jgi:hypothetical protein